MASKKKSTDKARKGDDDNGGDSKRTPRSSKDRVTRSPSKSSKKPKKKPAKPERDIKRWFPLGSPAPEGDGSSGTKTKAREASGTAKKKDAPKPEAGKNKRKHGDDAASAKEVTQLRSPKRGGRCCREGAPAPDNDPDSEGDDGSNHRDDRRAHRDSGQRTRPPHPRRATERHEQLLIHTGRTERQLQSMLRRRVLVVRHGLLWWRDRIGRLPIPRHLPSQTGNVAAGENTRQADANGDESDSELSSMGTDDIEELNPDHHQNGVAVQPGAAAAVPVYQNPIQLPAQPLVQLQAQLPAQVPAQQGPQQVPQQSTPGPLQQGAQQLPQQGQREAGTAPVDYAANVGIAAQEDENRAVPADDDDRHAPVEYGDQADTQNGGAIQSAVVSDPPAPPRDGDDAASRNPYAPGNMRYGPRDWDEESLQRAVDNSLAESRGEPLRGSQPTRRRIVNEVDLSDDDETQLVDMNADEDEDGAQDAPQHGSRDDRQDVDRAGTDQDQAADGVPSVNQDGSEANTNADGRGNSDVQQGAGRGVHAPQNGVPVQQGHERNGAVQDDMNFDFEEGGLCAGAEGDIDEEEVDDEVADEAAEYDLADEDLDLQQQIMSDIQHSVRTGHLQQRPIATNGDDGQVDQAPHNDQPDIYEVEIEDGGPTNRENDADEQDAAPTGSSLQPITTQRGETGEGQDEEEDEEIEADDVSNTDNDDVNSNSGNDDRSNYGGSNGPNTGDNSDDLKIIDDLEGENPTKNGSSPPNRSATNAQDQIGGDEVEEGNVTYEEYRRQYRQMLRERNAPTVTNSSPIRNRHEVLERRIEQQQPRNQRAPTSATPSAPPPRSAQIGARGSGSPATRTPLREFLRPPTPVPAPSQVSYTPSPPSAGDRLYGLPANVPHRRSAGFMAYGEDSSRAVAAARAVASGLSPSQLTSPARTPPTSSDFVILPMPRERGEFTRPPQNRHPPQSPLGSFRKRNSQSLTPAGRGVAQLCPVDTADDFEDDVPGPAEGLRRDEPSGRGIAAEDGQLAPVTPTEVAQTEVDNVDVVIKQEVDGGEVAPTQEITGQGNTEEEDAEEEEDVARGEDISEDEIVQEVEAEDKEVREEGRVAEEEGAAPEEGVAAEEEGAEKTVDAQDEVDEVESDGEEIDLWSIPPWPGSST